MRFTVGIVPDESVCAALPLLTEAKLFNAYAFASFKIVFAVIAIPGVKSTCVTPELKTPNLPNAVALTKFLIMLLIVPSSMLARPVPALEI